MLRELNIDGRVIKLKSTAGTPFRYKQNFGRDFFKDLFKLGKSLSKANGEADISNLSYEDIDQLDMETPYRLAWIFAKEATPEIPSFEKWVDSFDSLPIGDIMQVCGPMVSGLMKTKKMTRTNKKKSKNRK